MGTNLVPISNVQYSIEFRFSAHPHILYSDSNTLILVVPLLPIEVDEKNFLRIETALFNTFCITISLLWNILFIIDLNFDLFQMFSQVRQYGASINENKRKLAFVRL